MNDSWKHHFWLEAEGQRLRSLAAFVKNMTAGARSFANLRCSTCQAPAAALYRNCGEMKCTNGHVTKVSKASG